MRLADWTAPENSLTAAPQSSPESWTIRRVLDWTRGYLAKHHSTSPRLDAEILLAHACGCPRIQLYTRFDEVLSDDVRGRMRELVKRRAEHEPVAYLVGHREFFGLDFEVNRDVLIPRPETELLVLETLDAVKGIKTPHILEIGTGSGCIAVAVAVNATAAIVTAVDVSRNALAVASRNVARHQVDDRVTLLEGDLFAPISGTTFDVIVSNPPYVATGEAASLPPDVAQHEPEISLYA
ncbi:MAG: peptide chain release factor N(5)-glutamine methyltransferase, partial [Planctomycetaceae bacterium]|nr:peptide chain release factor N(5)-glutamine methyltransferase [Planctomycetaceae bacterium]